MSQLGQITVGNCIAKMTGDGGSWLIYHDAKHVSTMPARDFDRDGRRMMEAWNKGEDFVPTRDFAGKTMSPDEAERARLELLEHGHDATLTVEPWSRYLVAEEARQGGMLMGALGSVDAEQWPALVREVFASLYTDPKPLEQMATGAEWVRELVTQAEGQPEWSKLRRKVEGDPWAAGVAAAKVASGLAEKAKAMLEQAPAQDPQRLAEDTKAAEELFGPEHEVTQKAGHLAVTAATEAERMLEMLQGKKGSGMEQQVAAIMGEVAGDALAEVAGIVGGMGDMAGLGTGALRSVGGAPDAYRKALTKNPKLRKIAELAGRLRIRARAKQRTKTKYVPESIVDVTLGGEIERLLPTELAGLVMPETELQLMRKLQEREAMQYEMEGNEELDRGPIVLAVDGSGSMAGIRNEWAMAVAIAVLEIAAMQRRPFVLVHFDDQVKKVFTVEKPAALKLPELVEMVCYFSNGGTNFAAPLKKAHEIITSGKQKNGVFARADVMLVTDGMASWGDWARLVKETGASLYGVAIDCKFSEPMAQELTGCAHVSPHQLHDGSADVDLLFGI